MQDLDSYRQSLKSEDTIYFRSTSVFSALVVCYKNALYKFTFHTDILQSTTEYFLTEQVLHQNACDCYYCQSRQI